MTGLELQGILRTVVIQENMGTVELDMLVPVLEVDPDAEPEGAAARIMADPGSPGALTIRRQVLDVINNAALASADPLQQPLTLSAVHVTSAAAAAEDVSNSRAGPSLQVSVLATVPGTVMSLFGGASESGGARRLAADVALGFLRDRILGATEVSSAAEADWAEGPWVTLAISLSEVVGQMDDLTARVGGVLLGGLEGQSMDSVSEAWNSLLAEATGASSKLEVSLPLPSPAHFEGFHIILK